MSFACMLYTPAHIVLNKSPRRKDLGLSSSEISVSPSRSCFGSLIPNATPGDEVGQGPLHNIYYDFGWNTLLSILYPPFFLLEQYFVCFLITGHSRMESTCRFPSLPTRHVPFWEKNRLRWMLSCWSSSPFLAKLPTGTWHNRKKWKCWRVYKLDRL